MDRFCAGDNRALEALYDRHATTVHGFLVRMVRDQALAEDLMQQTFLSVVRSHDRFEPGAKFFPWLLTIAGNAARDTLRRKRQGVEQLIEVPPGREPSVTPAPSDPNVRKRIEAAFETLPPQQREAVLMHKVHGLPFADIANALGISETAARIRAHRGYEKLKTLLENVT